MRQSVLYVSDDYRSWHELLDDWKEVFQGNRDEAFGVSEEPLNNEHRVPLLLNMRLDPFEQRSHCVLL